MSKSNRLLPYLKRRRSDNGVDAALAAARSSKISVRVSAGRNVLRGDSRNHGHLANSKSSLITFAQPSPGSSSDSAPPDQPSPNFGPPAPLAYMTDSTDEGGGVAQLDCSSCTLPPSQSASPADKPSREAPSELLQAIAVLTGEVESLKARLKQIEEQISVSTIHVQDQSTRVLLERRISPALRELESVAAVANASVATFSVCKDVGDCNESYLATYRWLMDDSLATHLRALPLVKAPRKRVTSETLTIKCGQTWRALVRVTAEFYEAAKQFILAHGETEPPIQVAQFASGCASAKDSVQILVAICHVAIWKCSQLRDKRTTAIVVSLLHHDNEFDHEQLQEMIDASF